MPERQPDNLLPNWLNNGLPLTVLFGFPWLLGGQLLEAQLAGFAVAVVALACSFTRYRRSIKIPGVLSLCLIAYILTQFANPSYMQEWQTGLRIWYLKAVDFIAWLPSSIQSDFTDSSTLRFLLIVLTPCFCGLAIYQINHRFDRQVLLPLLVLNATAISLIGLVQLSFESRSILGSFQAVDEGLGLFFGTLLYKNHAAAFFNLGLASSLAGFFAFSRTARFRRSNPGGLFLVAGVVLLTGVIFSRSRFGFICSLGILALFGRLVFSHMKHAGLSKKALFACLGLVTGLAVGGGVYLFKSKGAKHLKTLNTEIVDDFSYKQRALAYQSAWNMFLEKPWFGWGAGNFRHGFRQFQNLEQEAANTGNANMTRRKQNFYWQHVHNDYLEWLIELGLVGTLLLFSIPAYFFWRTFKFKRWREPIPLMLLAGLGNTMAHGLVDFPFRNPAVLLTWFSLLVITAKYCSAKSTEPAQPAANMK